MWSHQAHLCIGSERLGSRCSGSSMHVYGIFYSCTYVSLSYIQQRQDSITALGCKSSTKMAEGSFVLREREKATCLKQREIESYLFKTGRRGYWVVGLRWDDILVILNGDQRIRRCRCRCW
jgi:hypothetical protein